MYVIFGATGNTGGVAARALLEAGLPVRAVGRDADRLKSLAEAGAEPVTADLTDPASIRPALSGATAAYVLIPPNFATNRFRAYQDQVTDAVLQASRESGVSRIVFLSSLGAEHPTGTGPVVGLHYFEEQARRVPNLSVLSLRAGYFMQNLLMGLDAVRSLGVYASPVPPGAPMALIEPSDIGRYAARRLAALDWSGFEVMNLVGPELVTPVDITAAIGKALGKPELPYAQISYDDAEQGMIKAGVNPSLAALYVELYQGAAKGLLAPEAGTPLVRTETTFTEFAPTFTAVYAQKTQAA